MAMGEAGVSRRPGGPHPQTMKTQSRNPEPWCQRSGATAPGRAALPHPAAWRGFSIVEITVVVALMAILIVAGLNTITLLDRSSRRQALHTSAMELAQGRLENFQSLAYNPPLAPFGASTTTQSTNVILALDQAGAATLVGAAMTTTITPVAQGHLVTVTVSTTNADQAMNVQLQTMINEKSGNKP